jgi:RHH-type proline utilization regulon transcriptional repressor/proline dehydrogenase/delta 1-pyrroline-5-carboxylate dehydrogenase
MMGEELNDRIIARGKGMFSAIRHEKPTIFDTGSMLGRIMEWAMGDDRFRTRLFRFVDLFPSLKSGEQLTRHIREYFGSGDDLPPLLAAAVASSGMLGSLGGSVLSAAIGANIHEMAKQFIIGETLPDAVRNLGRLRRDGFAFAVDLLGEATLSPEEAGRYAAGCLELLTSLEQAARQWHPLPGSGPHPELDWGDTPLINIAVKPSALYCLADPRDFDGSVEAILHGIIPIVNRARQCGAFLCIDMEQTRMKGITLEVYRRLKQLHPDYPWLGVALQAYLRDTDRDLEELLFWAKEGNIPIAIRLVKGAYWDYEITRAAQNGWPPPVWTLKAESDAAFERHTRRILENHPICHFACATHNIRSIAAALESARELEVPAGRYEFQVLYGMAEPVRKVLLQQAGRIRLYAPYGEMVPGMGYLVRRLLENTANESFLRRTFAEDMASDSLLEDPVAVAQRHQTEKTKKSAKTSQPTFRNEPAADFTRPELASAFRQELAAARTRFGARIPLLIDGADVVTTELLASVNPAAPQEVVGRVCLAGSQETSAAIRAARNAFPLWRDTPVNRRVEVVQRAAAITRGRLVELAALQVLEIGKQWDQAYADVTEAIDFLEFYALQMLRLGTPAYLGHVPGETNRSFYEPCGVAAVIAPWNFPLAISCGMAAAALVAGNCVVYKPSSLTPVIGRRLADIFAEAGIPRGVFNYLPAQGSVVGDLLVSDTDVDLIAFTGSSETGLGIIEKAAARREGQRGVKRVICEMGGKNAAIVDDDADLDEAIPQILQAAFGFQGQKCSACSRVIVLESIYEQFVARFIPAAAALTVGPAENPAFFFGPAADPVQQRKVLEYIDIGREEGKLLHLGTVPDGPGYYVPMAIFTDIRPEHRLAREEIFGPVLAIMRAGDFTSALAIANSTPQALTGSVFSRSPANLQRSGVEFRVGNLYLNRGCTGALVERQPFGGFRLSGGGTKAGGGDYLLNFMIPRVVTENTMRRGFAPQFLPD